MENEKKINEYIRTKQGYIAKVEDIDNDFIFSDETIYCDGYEEMPLLPIKKMDLITEHSENLIGLVKTGDYVNGDLIEEILFLDIEGRGKEKILLYDTDFPIGNSPLRCYRDHQIKSIVTKEQFNSMSYKV